MRPRLIDHSVVLAGPTGASACSLLLDTSDLASGGDLEREEAGLADGASVDDGATDATSADTGAMECAPSDTTLNGLRANSSGCGGGEGRRFVACSWRGS